MAGSLLVNHGDVQLGSDSSSPVLLSRFNASGTYDPNNHIRAIGFNPFVWPDITTDDTPWWHKHGLHPGADIPTGRRIEFDVFVSKSSATLFAQAVQSIAYVCQPVLVQGTVQELAFRWNGVNYVLYGRFRQMDFVDTGEIGLNQTRIRLRFLATDPIIYEATTQVASIPVDTTERTNFHDAPNTAISQANTAASPPYINMGGDAPPRWVAQINGPARNPVLLNAESVQFTWLSYTSGIAIFSGQNWKIDSAQHKILNTAGNDGGRYHVWPSHWLDLSPGANKNKLLICNNVNFTGNSQSLPAGTTVAGTLTWQRGWWVLPS